MYDDDDVDETHPYETYGGSGGVPAPGPIWNIAGKPLVTNHDGPPLYLLWGQHPQILSRVRPATNEHDECA